ncbi:DNA repair exonuclease SbcCD ATPase subunit [Mycobacterium frederiksbergense]|uniref:Nuclease SbcCD subunit C n=1 Tax=Mycolicibacterium frederiksbergense TaxID=117567 RepID=A0ABT6L4W7_9MYCO|nr:AAA family ATPase [Mycolicibacterium frederiksbergense]MDH6197999.1 DNA repair exonuclease SbcCD ATPase subunit [Mycolicibacterium frederiksbergense]
MESLTTAEDESTEPVGAYLRSITVQGFRGIGTAVTLPFQPGAGLTVVAGRNGSGKSTLAEGLELALTGKNSRWNDKAGVWSQNWRNLHAGEPAQIRITLAEEASGPTTIGVDWPAGNDVDVDNCKSWVQRDGQKRESVSALGWAGALEMYRPLLSYDELGGILEGRPSDFYDQLHKLLGLEQLTEAMARLDTEVKQLKQPSDEQRKARNTLRPKLEAHDDPRAAQALVQLKKRRPDLGAIRPLVTDGTASSLPSAWVRAEALSTPPDEEVSLACEALRSAADIEQKEITRADALAADRGRLVEMSLEFHEAHGDQKCPVCGHGDLTAEWATAARSALEQDQRSAKALAVARAATKAARAALANIVHSVEAPPESDGALTTLAAAQTAYTAFAAVPTDGHHALADHVQQTLSPLRQAYAAVQQEATSLIKARQDAWNPVALDLADWLRKAEQAYDVEAQLNVASEALQWLQDNAAELRNQRISPLAEEARQIWAALRQESNVELGAIQLVGQKTSRRVLLKAAVDGSDTEAFGVMSQGELQALALAVFIPRATSAASPFRFMVLDDPIQAMDPSKIDGLLQVLTRLAENRQVIVFTHDDRLPAAIRRSHVPARVVEVVRGMNSTVTVSEASRPATRMLADAYAIAADDAVPAAIKKAAVPVLCRDALESTAWDVFSARRLAQGQSHAELEQAWEKARSTKKRLGLAVDSDNEAAVDKWLSGGAARRQALWTAAKGVHEGVDDYREAVKATRLAVGDLVKLAS